MATPPTAAARKRMLLLVFALGLIAGIATYTVMKALSTENFALVAVLLPMLLVAGALGRELLRLRRTGSPPA